MRILISGSTGLVGSALIASLRSEGHTILRLARPSTRQTALTSSNEKWIRWDPAAGSVDSTEAEGCDALVSLAGASIGEGRWSDARKALLRSSRVDATRQLISALAKLSRPPRVVITASAVGYYGDRGDETLTEQSAPGTDFLARLAADWESESLHAEQFRARVVLTRFGLILAKRGGALPRMLLPFKLGVGGRLGSGKQWMSWIAIEDIVEILKLALRDERCRGPVNCVAPNPVRNSEFTIALAKSLRRPAIFPAPAFALRLALGEMADALLLSSQRVQPAKLESLGYAFRHSQLADALVHVLI